MRALFVDLLFNIRKDLHKKTKIDKNDIISGYNFFLNEKMGNKKIG
jgi:hypothetical protein